MPTLTPRFKAIATDAVALVILWSPIKFTTIFFIIVVLLEENVTLKSKIEKFRRDEVHHKSMAYESGATNKGIYTIMDKLIRTGSRIAINISEKIKMN